MIKNIKHLIFSLSLLLIMPATATFDDLINTVFSEYQTEVTKGNAQAATMPLNQAAVYTLAYSGGEATAATETQTAYNLFGAQETYNPPLTIEKAGEEQAITVESDFVKVSETKYPHITPLSLMIVGGDTDKLQEMLKLLPEDSLTKDSADIWGYREIYSPLQLACHPQSLFNGGPIKSFSTRIQVICQLLDHSPSLINLAKGGNYKNPPLALHYINMGCPLETVIATEGENPPYYFAEKLQAVLLLLGAEHSVRNEHGRPDLDCSIGSSNKTNWSFFSEKNGFSSKVSANFLGEMYVLIEKLGYAHLMQNPTPEIALFVSNFRAYAAASADAERSKNPAVTAVEEPASSPDKSEPEASEKEASAEENEKSTQASCVLL
tara:strand:- start:4447 stop:5583 length:1137 start_codon:yes stop_codon:yes gene_type:complete